MNRHLTVIGAILRKDIVSLWPLLLLVVLLQILWTLDANLDLQFISVLVKGFLPQIVQLASVFLILAVIHLDAAASLRHDWLTRPIPRFDLIAAKGIFILIATVLPISLADLSANLLNEQSLAESILIATAIQRMTMIVIALALIAIAFLTSTLVEAVVALISAFAVLLFVPLLATRVSSIGEEILYLGSGWVLLYADGLLIIVAIGMAGWLQYARRNTTLARTAFAVAMLAVASSPALLTWDRIFSIQKVIATDPATALKIELTPDCFPATILNPVPTGMEELADDAIFNAYRRREAGPNAIAFSTAVIPSGAPTDWKVMISRVSATYRGANDEILQTLRPARFTPTWKLTANGARSANHFWLLPRDAYQRLASRPSHLRLDYSLSLLQPRTVELPIDGMRKYIPEFGYCGAKLDQSTQEVKVNCFKHGAQPALVAAEIVGAPPQNAIDDYPDYTPSWLELFGGKRYRFTLRQESGVLASRIKLIAYEARAHTDRHLDAPGVLGGPVSACSAPPAN